ncbi:hypothetical protein SEA_LILYPAD_37 [Gordonia phage LilyPad]|nr:hypothetical protein SEA_LILYPAD_37 [Gordonia phage LilyPad]
MSTTDFRTRYGAWETNGLDDPNEYFSVDREQVLLSDPRIRRVTRLRLISDPGFPYWDVSYCHGELKDGTPVRIQIPVPHFRKRTLKGDIIAMAKREGVFAKGLGLLDEGVWSKCQ